MLGDILTDKSAIGHQPVATRGVANVRSKGLESMKLQMREFLDAASSFGKVARQVLLFEKTMIPSLP